MMKSMQKSSRHTQGMSLVEILVVIAIMAVLMAVMIPNLTGAKKRAASKEMQQYGGMVSMNVNGFLTSRPGMRADTLINAFPTNAPALPAGSTVVLGSVSKSCSQGHTLGGTETAPTVSGSGGVTAAGSSWPAAPADGFCIVTTDPGSNEYATRIITWSNQWPSEVYVNGRKP